MVLRIFVLSAFQQCGQSLSPLDISLLCAFGVACKQDDDLRTKLFVIKAPARAKVDAQLHYTIGTPSPIALKPPSKPNESRLTRSVIAPRTLKSFRSIKPCGELGKRPDGKHGRSVIVRLQNVKQATVSRPRQSGHASAERSRRRACITPAADKAAAAGRAAAILSAARESPSTRKRPRRRAGSRCQGGRC